LPEEDLAAFDEWLTAVDLDAIFGAKEKKFLDYLAEFGKSYDTTDEFNMRLNEFILTDIEVEQFNKMNLSFKLGHNDFSTWTKNEQ